MKRTPSVKHWVEGARGTRKSPRVYTHAVCAVIDWDARLAFREQDRVRYIEANWFYYLAIDGQPVGQWITGPRGEFQVTEDHLKAAAEFFGWVKTKDLFAAKMWAVQDVREEIRKKKTEPYAHDVQVLQWSMSENNAHKATRAWAKRHYKLIHVRSVERDNPEPGAMHCGAAHYG